MTKQGAPAQQPRPDDGWWDTVYAGPAGTLPDTPDATPGEGSVDDWFETAAGLIGHQRSGEDAATQPEPEPEPEPEPGPGPEAAVGADPVVDTQVLERDSIDDWFDTAVGVISPQPSDPGETHRFPAPPWADDGPVKSPGASAPAPERAPAPEQRPATPPEQAPEQASEPEPAAERPDLRKPEPEPKPEAARVPEPRPRPEPAAVEEPVPASVPVPVPVTESVPAVAERPEPDPAPEQAPAATPTAAAPAPAPAPRPAVRAGRPGTAPAVPHVGERPPTYGPEPTAVPEADPGALGSVVADTVLEGAQYATTTLRATSVRGDSARYRGEPRRDALLVTRFGEGTDGLLLAVLGGFDRAGPAGGPAAEEVAVAAAEACRQLATSIGRSRTGLAADLRDGARDRLRYGLQRLATGASAPLRALVPDPDPAADPASDPAADPASATGPDGEAEPSPVSLHCLLVSLDPAAGYRAAFGVGPGGLYLLRSGHWIDAYAARLLHHPDGQPPVPEGQVPGARPFRFRMVPATPGDILLLCTPGLARPIADEPAVAHFLASHWAHPHPPGTVDFLRQVQVRAKGYADDRTAAAVWTE
ncbi:hypothetical protein [Kitasatospora sp. NPDC002965]|uniref:hypothetical protein n=1 Tax=Kitasatospora sp. NPDC002965 TaxID=3154775 RepID=UPI0033BBCEF5